MTVTVRKTLERARAIDLAWNERRWDHYAALLSDNLVAYASGEATPHGKQEHVDRARRLCESMPDNVVHVDPYVDLFASYDSEKSCSIARITGTTGGACFDVTFVAVCRWRDGIIIEQHQ